MFKMFEMFKTSKTSKTSKPVGQEVTKDFIKISKITARPYPNTKVLIKFKDGTIKSGTVSRDDSIHDEDPKKIMVKYDDGKTDRFTSDNGDVSIQNLGVMSHYRGGRKRKTHRNKNSKKSIKSKSRRR